MVFETNELNRKEKRYCKLVEEPMRGAVSRGAGSSPEQSGGVLLGRTLNSHSEYLALFRCKAGGGGQPDKGAAEWGWRVFTLR